MEVLDELSLRVRLEEARLEAEVVDQGHMHSDTAAGLVGAAIISTLVYPLVGLWLRRGSGDKEDEGLGAEPAPA